MWNPYMYRGQCVWDFWCLKWHWGRLISKNFVIPWKFHSILVLMFRILLTWWKGAESRKFPIKKLSYENQKFIFPFFFLELCPCFCFNFTNGQYLCFELQIYLRFPVACLKAPLFIEKKKYFYTDVLLYNQIFMVRRISHVGNKSSIILSRRFWPFVRRKK